SKAWRYLPLRLNAKARRWVRDAVRAGGSNDVRLRLRGDLADFPFVAPDQGEFLVTAAIESGRLAFDSEWPALEAVEGKLRFERGSMSFEGSRAKIFDVALGGISARIEDLDNAVLKVVGKGEGPLAEMIRVLRESPLRKHIGDGIERLRFDGPASVDLRLELPFHDI